MRTGQSIDTGNKERIEEGPVSRWCPGPGEGVPIIGKAKAVPGHQSGSQGVIGALIGQHLWRIDLVAQVQGDAESQEDGQGEDGRQVKA